MSECVMAQHTILAPSKSFTPAMELLQQFYGLKIMTRSFDIPRHHWFTNATYSDFYVAVLCSQVWHLLEKDF